MFPSTTWVGLGKVFIDPGQLLPWLQMKHLKWLWGMGKMPFTINAWANAELRASKYMIGKSLIHGLAYLASPLPFTVNLSVQHSEQSLQYFFPITLMYYTRKIPSHIFSSHSLQCHIHSDHFHLHWNPGDNIEVILSIRGPLWIPQRWPRSALQILCFFLNIPYF